MKIIEVTPDISGSMVKAPGGFVVSVFHHTTNRALYGFEATADGALGWLQASRLIFEHAEGSA
jgi:hypothetical protein